MNLDKDTAIKMLLAMVENAIKFRKDADISIEYRNNTFSFEDAFGRADITFFDPNEILEEE